MTETEQPYECSTCGEMADGKPAMHNEDGLPVCPGCAESYKAECAEQLADTATSLPVSGDES